jgi:hypothetical protein
MVGKMGLDLFCNLETLKFLMHFREPVSILYFFTYSLFSFFSYIHIHIYKYSYFFLSLFSFFLFFIFYFLFFYLLPFEL